MGIAHVLSLAAILAIAPLPLASCARGPAGELVSRPGEYRGYSRPLYKEWIRTSRYVEVRDGTRIAVDIFRPAVKGEPVAEPLPVVWTHTRYGREMRFLWGRYDIIRQFPWLRTLLRHGYVVACADVRGSGASFGTRRLEYSPEEARDAYDLTEWFAAQAWCNGKVGMFGRSYLGSTQLLAAGQAPPHLVAIFPEMCMTDNYSTCYPGGIYRVFLETWSLFTNRLDTTTKHRPVDGDRDGTLFRAAREEHLANMDVTEVLRRFPFRDSRDEAGGLMSHEIISPLSHLDGIEKSGVAVYFLAGWFDGFSRDMVVCYNNLTNPKKLTVGPWHHTDTKGFDLGAEHLRWYDYWLKGIENGIMSEPPIRYCVMDGTGGGDWRASWQWPPPEVRDTRFFLHPGRTGSIDSANDGLLNETKPLRSGYDEYVTDYTTTSGSTSRWKNLNAGPFRYRNLAANDRKGLTYTTPPLERNLEIVGHPVIRLRVSSTAGDGDFFAYLEDVDAHGRSRYVTEGVLRASHRALAEPPYAYLGLPYHRSYKEDLRALKPGEAVELNFDLLPTAWLFQAGHRLRLTITCADKDNAITPKLSPPPRIRIHLGGESSSCLALPVI